MPKILFIQPTQRSGDGRLCKQKRIHLPGLVFPLLAAMTPDSWEVEVKLEVVDEIDFDADADIVAIGTMGYAIFRGIEIAAEFRKRGKLVVMGGYMASIAVNDALQHVDSVVVGDAEHSYLQLLHDYETNGKVQRIYDNPVSDLAGLPVPRYELLLEKPIGNMLPVQAGRGCPHLCSFCSIACLYQGKYLCRPVEEVVRDIRAVRDAGFKRFYLVDDNIASNPGYLEAICEAIAPLNMRWASQCSLSLAKNARLLELVKRSGADMMSFGIESITQDGLDRLGKSWLQVDEHERLIARITEAGLMVSAEMFLGTDSDTQETIEATYAFVERTRIPIPRFYILTPIPGTALYEQYKNEGRLLTEDFTRYDGCTCVHRPAMIPAERLTELYWWLNEKVFSLPSIFRRTIGNPWARKSPLSYLFAFVVNMHYRKYIRRRVAPNIF